MLLSNVALQQRIVTTKEGVLSYREYHSKEPILITNMGLAQIQPCSVDFHISDDFPLLLTTSTITLNKPQNLRYIECVRSSDNHGKFYCLTPGNTYLMKSYEYFRIPSDLCGQVRGCSTNGRMGFVPHKEAGLLDPGWEGHITLEVEVTRPSYLYPVYDGKRFRVAQVVFEQLDEPASPPYQGRYQGDTVAQPPKEELHHE